MPADRSISFIIEPSKSYKKDLSELMLSFFMKDFLHLSRDRNALSFMTLFSHITTTCSY